jgi:hypothetical protein
MLLGTRRDGCTEGRRQGGCGRSEFADGVGTHSGKRQSVMPVQ